MFLVLSFASPAFSQISTKTGTIYGKVADSQSIALPGVNVTLESEIIPSQSSITGPGGGFRFANLPPGEYSATFHIPDFMDVKEEGIHVSTGASVDLRIIMKPAIAEQVEVISESALSNIQQAGTGSVYSQVELNQIPNGRDPWALIAQTPGVVSDRFNTGSQQGQQAVFYARGGGFSDNTWNYDGVNESQGGSSTYYDFDAFEEIQISTGGSDASIQTGGVVINLVTKRAGNQWHANLSGYFADKSLQSSNTPQELIDNPIINPVTGMPVLGSNRINQLQEYGFNAGGPIVKDKFFFWGGYRKYHIDLFTVEDAPNNTTLTDYNAKLNFNWNQRNEAQAGYFKGLKDVVGKAAFPAVRQTPETLQVQDNTPIQGIWTAQNTWIPNDKFLLTARYGYVGSGVSLIPVGGNQVPMIYLYAISLFESTFNYLNPIEQRAQDFNADANYFKEELLGGDHEFKFGFEYKNTSFHTFSSYGNGVYIVDYYQTNPGGPLTSGSLTAQHFRNGKVKNDRVSFYATDTYRRDRLTLNLGFRFDHQSGKNLASSVPAIPGFENDVGAYIYPGGDPGIAFNNFSPRLGAAFDLSGNGKTILRGNFARYYSYFDPSLITFSNPTFSYNGATYSYENKNGDRNITPDEITGGPNFYGGLSADGFDLATKKYNPDLSNSWTNEFIVGIERELSPNLSFAASYIYRRYGNFTSAIPFGVDTSDYVPAGIYDSGDTVLGDFSVPYFALPPGFIQDGTGIETNIKDYYQSYQGMEFVLKKRMSSNFLLNGSFVLQKQTAHYKGGDSLGFVLGRQFAFDPTNLPFLNDRPYAYFGGKTAVFPNSNWSLKVSGVYQFPWDLQAGAFLRYQQGFPYILQARVRDTSFSKFDGSIFHFFFVEPYGSRRLDNVFSLDINIQKGFAMQKYGRLTLIMDVFNVTNANTVLGRFGNLWMPNFNQITEVLSPRAVRLGLNYSF